MRSRYCTYQIKPARNASRRGPPAPNFGFCYGHRQGRRIFRSVVTVFNSLSSQGLQAKQSQVHSPAVVGPLDVNFGRIVAVEVIRATSAGVPPPHRHDMSHVTAPTAGFSSRSATVTVTTPRRINLVGTVATGKQPICAVLYFGLTPCRKLRRAV